MKLVDMTICDFLNEVDSNSPAPGGGSVAALASALGASLTRMVAHLSFGKKKYKELDEETRVKFEKVFAEMLEVKNSLVELVDKDTEAYNLVMSAYKLPKETEEEKAHKDAEIQKSLKLAIQTPLDITELSAKAIKIMGTILEYGNKNAVTDIGVACLLFFTGLEGGILNVKINLSSVTDEAYVTEIREKLTKLLAESAKTKEEIMAVVNSSI